MSSPLASSSVQEGGAHLTAGVRCEVRNSHADTCGIGQIWLFRIDIRGLKPGTISKSQSDRLDLLSNGIHTSIAAGVTCKS